MKKFFKFNYLFVIFVILSLFYAIFYAVDYKTNRIDNNKTSQILKETCSKEENKDTEVCQSFLANNSSASQKIDTLTVYYDFINSSVFKYLSVFGIILVSCCVLQKIKYDESAKYHLIREDYFSYLKKFFKKAFSCCFLLPTILLISFICSYLVSQSFDYTYAIQSSLSTFDPQHLILGWKFFFLIEVSMFIMSFIYICYTLLAYRFVNNKYVALVLAFMILIVNEIFIDLVIGFFLSILLQINTHSYLNLINTLNFVDVPNIYIYIFIRLIILVVYFVIVLLVYRNKESYVLQVEKMEDKKR